MAKAARVVQLVRVSTKAQKDQDTPATQIHALDGLLSRRGGVLVERIEAVVSGGADTVDRPDIQRLRVLAEAQAFDEVHVYKLDRLTRHDDPTERFFVFSLCAKAEAVIVDAGGQVIDPADPSGMGEIGFFLQTWAGAGERRKIGDRSRTAASKNRALGRRTGGKAPMGLSYDKTTGVWSTTPDMPMVRVVFERLVDGASLKSLLKFIGPRSRNVIDKVTDTKVNITRLLTIGGVRALIANPLYRGLTEAGLRVFEPDQQPVSDDVWHRAQARLAAIKGAHKRVKDAAPLWATGLVWSAFEHDGWDMSKPYRHSMFANRAPNRSDRYRCMCSDASKGLDKCGIGYRNAEAVHGWIDAALAKLTTDPDTVRAVRQQVATPDVAGLRAELEKTMKRMDARQERIKDAFYEGLESKETFKRRTDAYKVERQAAQDRLDALTKANVTANPAEVETWLAGFSWEASWSATAKRDWLRKYTVRMTITRDGIGDIVLRVPGRDGLPVRIGLQATAA